MKINKRLLPLKGHFFFNAAGTSAIAPFVPVIAKQLGFSSVSVGWILTVSPLLAVFCKPFIGAFADKTKHKKLLFISLILSSAICGFCIKWINPVYDSNTASICSNDDNYAVKICREVLKEENNRERLNSLSASVNCEITPLKHTVSKNIELTQNSSIISRSDLEITNVFAAIQNISIPKDGCAYMMLEFTNKSTPYLNLPNCTNAMDSIIIQCNNPFLNKVLRKPLDDFSMLSRKEFWLFLLFAVGNYIGFSSSNSLGDAITFSLLGQKAGNYGMQRAWGSVGWGIFSVIIGLIVDKLSENKLEIDYTVSYYMMMSLILIDVLISLRLQVKILHKSKSIKKDVIKLFKEPEVIVSGIWCFTIGFLFAYLWAFLFWYLEDLAKQNGDFDKSWIKTLEGALQLVQCIGEAPFIFYSGNIIKWLGHKNSMTVVLFGFSARFLCYTVLSNPWWILPIELLNGITFGLFYPTMTSYASAIAPKGTEATVQNIFSCLYEGIDEKTVPEEEEIINVKKEVIQKMGA